MVNKLKRGVAILMKGHIKEFISLLLERIYSKSYSFGLKSSSTIYSLRPSAKIDISVRLIAPQDIDYLLDDQGLSNEEAKLVSVQQKLVSAKIGACYVAVTQDNAPCYMQILFRHSDNASIKNYFGNQFPELKEHEALLEGAFMKHTYRGLGIMPDAMCRIVEKAGEIGATEVITFVNIDNIPSLKGCKACGFYPYILRELKWVLFKKHYTFKSIPDEMLLKHKIFASSLVKTT